MHQQRFDDPYHEADDARTALAPAGSTDPALCSGPVARTIEHRFAAAPRLITPAAILIVGYIAMVGVLRIERYIPAHLQRVPHEDALTPTLAEAPG